MLGSFRKFSNSITAKIFLFIVAIPFIFWGMGDLFSGGKQNTIATISKDKISTNSESLLVTPKSLKNFSGLNPSISTL